MHIDIEEGIPRDLKKILGRQYIFLLRLNEFNLKDGFENYIVAKIFDAPSNEKKVWNEKKKKKNTSQYAILFLSLRYTDVNNMLKFNMNADTYARS